MVLAVLVVSGDDGDDGDSVRLHLHFLHHDVIRAAIWVPIPFPLLHAAVMAETRMMLNPLTVLQGHQRAFEAHQARAVLATGRAPSLSRCVDPAVMHDACSLYTGCLTGLATGEPKAWFDDGEACGACGARAAWGMSCTPPRWTRDGRLARDHFDELVTFCWRCLARRDLTHMAPQKEV